MQNLSNSQLWLRVHRFDFGHVCRPDVFFDSICHLKRHFVTKKEFCGPESFLSDSNSSVGILVRLLFLILVRIKVFEGVGELVGFHLAFVGAEEGFVAFA